MLWEHIGIQALFALDGWNMSHLPASDHSSSVNLSLQWLSVGIIALLSPVGFPAFPVLGILIVIFSVFALVVSNHHLH